MNKKTNIAEKIVIILLFFIITIISPYFNNETEKEVGNIENNNNISYEISNIPEYSGQPYIEINNNNPNFTTEDMNLEEDYYSTLKDGKVRNGDYKNLLGKSKPR